MLLTLSSFLKFWLAFFPTKCYSESTGLLSSCVSFLFVCNSVRIGQHLLNKVLALEISVLADFVNYHSTTLIEKLNESSKNNAWVHIDPNRDDFFIVA